MSKQDDNSFRDYESYQNAVQARDWDICDLIAKEHYILMKKINKLKSLLLLVDPVVSNVEVSDTQLKQWSEFVKCFPDEGDNKKVDYPAKAETIKTW